MYADVCVYVLLGPRVKQLQNGLRVKWRTPQRSKYKWSNQNHVYKYDKHELAVLENKRNWVTAKCGDRSSHPQNNFIALGGSNFFFCFNAQIWHVSSKSSLLHDLHLITSLITIQDVVFAMSCKFLVDFFTEWKRGKLAFVCQSVFLQFSFLLYINRSLMPSFLTYFGSWFL